MEKTFLLPSLQTNKTKLPEQQQPLGSLAKPCNGSQASTSCKEASKFEVSDGTQPRVNGSLARVGFIMMLDTS